MVILYPTAFYVAKYTGLLKANLGSEYCRDIMVFFNKFIRQNSAPESILRAENTDPGQYSLLREIAIYRKLVL